jgi:hypothetical protein
MKTIAFILLILSMASCEKPAEKFDFTCMVNVNQYENGHCIGAYSYRESHTMTTDEHIYWIHSKESEIIQIVNSDTLMVITKVDKCGKYVCN